MPSANGSAAKAQKNSAVSNVDITTRTACRMGRWTRRNGRSPVRRMAGAMIASPATLRTSTSCPTV